MPYLSKILSYSKWTLLSALLTLVLQLGLYLLIANKVDPETLGNYFLASALIFIPAGIMEYAFSSSLIHTESPTTEDYAAVFRINLKIAGLFILIGGLIAGALSVYYSKSILLYCFLALAPILLLLTYNSVQYAGLKKNLRIKTFSLIELTATLISFAATAVLILLGYELIALIVGQLLKYLTATSLLLSKSKYLKPSLTPSAAIRQKHWDYGQYILAEKSLSIGVTQMDTFLIHHFLGAEILGVYDLLKRMVLRPLLTAYTAIEQVVFPLLCDPSSNYRTVFISFIRTNYLFLGAGIGIPLATWILHFFPENYQAYTYVFQLIILLAVSMMIFNPVDVIAYSLGKTQRYFYWILAYSLVQLFVMAIVLQYGLVPFLIVTIFYNLIIYIISYFIIIDKTVKVSFWDWSHLALVFLLFSICFTLFLN